MNTQKPLPGSQRTTTTGPGPGFRRLLLLALAAVPTVVGAAEERSHFVLETVRVIYSTSGASAVPPEDRDDNGVPDRVEDVARQVWAARKFYCEWLDFPDPLESPRFGRVDCIQVSIHAKEKINGLNGVAYRRAQKAKAIPDGSPGDRTLVLAVANTVDPIHNPTPAHEFFHLIQYGATYFSNRWFLEGMARWSETPWRTNPAPATALRASPAWQDNEEKKETLFQMSYEAATAFWNPLASASTEKADGTRERKLPAKLRDLVYSDGSPVLRTPAAPGTELMRDILRELARVDDIAKKKLGHEEWTLARQGAPENNAFLFDAVMAVAKRRGVAPE
ncbi:MAG: hypothetical protein GXX91_09845 [Verrucomicrobiaceae bacterium]|nr:hypothetical protein [Verrucomicrobiaceae bacterium]